VWGEADDDTHSKPSTTVFSSDQDKKDAKRLTTANKTHMEVGLFKGK
jgi:hypothetical protein